jgi:hypothetical protein
MGLLDENGTFWEVIKYHLSRSILRGNPSFKASSVIFKYLYIQRICEGEIKKLPTTEFSE